MVESGLVLVSVPIGNIQDITERANQALASGQVIVAEDTRVLKELLQSLNINYSDKNIFSYHDHSGDHGIKGIISLIQKGQSVVYVSDAGSPIISDPAYPLIRAVLEADLNLVSIPGVSSILVALELSGLPASPFSFIGFLPREKKDLRKRLDSLREGMTYIFFEAPHRIEESLQVMSEKWPEGRFALCRELTKKYESVYRFLGADWGKVHESEGFVLKGEFVGVLYLPPSEKGKKSVDLEECRKIALKMLEEGGGGKKKDLAKLLGEVLGREAKEIYQAISCKSSHSNLE